MKKFFFGLIGLLVVLAAAILILPGLIDWSEYKNDFTRQAKVLTGRAVTIGGDLRLALLPAPALIAGNVGVSNLEGASAPHMARLKSLEVRIALLPLLRGEVQVETVRLIEPVIELEVLADGRRNWDIKPAGAKSKAATPGGSEFMPDVRLENLEIKDGTLVFRDSGAGTVEQFKAINVQISARSLKGPFESSGGLTARGLPLSYDLSVGEVVEGRTVPFSLTLGMAALKARAEVSGAVFNPFEGAKFRGTVKTEGENLAKLIRTFSDTGPLPGYLAQSFALNGPVEASAKEVNAKELSLAFGETKGMVSVRAEMGKVPKIFTRVKAGRINLDKLLEMKPGRDDPELSMTKGTGDQSSKNKIPSSIPASGLPAGVSGTLELAVDTLTYRGGVIHQMKVNGELNGGELTLSQFSAQLPGGSDFAVFGFVSAKKGGLRFEGELEASVSDLRGVMDWLGQAPPPVPADRLRRISMKSKINATADQVQISALDVRFDSTRLQGGVTLALRSRLAFGADLRLDRINLDAYLKELPKNKKKNSSFNPFADLKVLDTFDANYKVQIDNAVYQGLTFKKMTFDGTLHNGSLKIKSAGIDDMDGTKIAANGMLRDLTKTLRMENLHFDMASRDLAGVFQLTGTPSPIDPKKLGPVSAKGTVNGTLQDPVFDVTLQAADISGRVEGVLKGLPLITKVDKLNVDLKSPNLAKFFRLAQTSPPVDPNRLGAVAVKGSVKGSVLTPEVDVTVKAGGGEAGIKGTISILPIGGGLNGTVYLRHGDLTHLLQVLQVDYRPQGRVGGVELTSQVTADPKAVSLSGLKGKIGTTPFEGSLNVALGGVRPKLTGDLRTGAVGINPYLPVQKAAFLRDLQNQLFGPADGVQGGVIPAAFVLPARTEKNPAVREIAVSAPGERWSRDPIDLSILGTFDADLKLKSQAVMLDRYRLDNADIDVSLAGGVLTSRRLAGNLFGGLLQGGLILRAAKSLQVDTEFSLSNADFGAALEAATGKRQATGRLAMNIKAAANGRSVADLVKVLGGNGSLNLTQVDVRAGIPIPVKAAISGPYTIRNGVINFSNIQLATNVGNGFAQGAIDLPGWWMDVGGELRLTQDALTQMLAGLVKLQTSDQIMKFRLRGPLDNPQKQWSALPVVQQRLQDKGGRLLQKKLQNKVPGALGDILQQVIPGQQPQQQQPQSPPPSNQGGLLPPPPPPPNQQQQQQPLRPEQQLLQELFRKR